MTAFPPGDQPPLRSADPAEPSKTRRGQTVIVAILLFIAIAVVLVLLL
jgi:flagellin-like protein